MARIRQTELKIWRNQVFVKSRIVKGLGDIKWRADCSVSPSRQSLNESMRRYLVRIAMSSHMRCSSKRTVGEMKVLLMSWVKKKETKEEKSYTQVKVWHIGIRNVMKHVWRITCCHMEGGKWKCKIWPGNVKGNIFQVGLCASVVIHIREHDGSENVAKKKCQSRLLVPLDLSNVSDFARSWILVDFINLQKKKG